MIRVAIAGTTRIAIWKNALTRVVSANSTQICFENGRFLRFYSQNSKESSSLTKSKQSSGEVSTSVTFETVKENTKTAWYLGVIAIGVAFTGSIIWVVVSELFSGNSPNNIYSKAFSRCKNDQRIQDHLGEPIKGYGEENARGRRRHVSYGTYIRNGRKYLSMNFYIEGSRKKGTVVLEMRMDDNDNFQYNVLAVQLDDLLRTQIVLEDNRHLDNVEPSPLSSESNFLKM